jgi:hypothetical protein
MFPKNIGIKCHLAGRFGAWRLGLSGERRDQLRGNRDGDARRAEL